MRRIGFIHPSRSICSKALCPIILAALLSWPGASAVIHVWTGGIATADANVSGEEIFRIADLDDAATGGAYALNGGSVPEFRVEFEAFNPEQPRVVNTWFAPIAVSDELGGVGLRQFAFGEQIGPTLTIDWGGFGAMETLTETTIWNTNSVGYAGFRVDRGSGNFHYGWALFDYRDGDDQIELLAFALESELNTPILAGAVPEPATGLLLGAAAGLGTLVRRRSRSSGLH